MCEVSKEPVFLTCGSVCAICLVRNVFQIYCTLGWSSGAQHLLSMCKALVLILHTVKDINVNRIWSFIQSQVYRCNNESSEIMPKECT